MAYLIVGPTWTVLDRDSRRSRAADIHHLFQRFRQLVCVTICPTAGEAGALRREGVATLHCSEGALVREDLYRPSRDRQPKFDAIYDAKWADYKRHQLAGCIRSLALIAPPPWRPEEGCTIDHYRRAHAAVSHATWVSSPWGPTRRWLSPEEVNVAYNEARVGLCLSRVEGYMSASVQYLLAGLPVVTTANLGGRDEFFDPAYVRWVGDEPEAVAAAVDELAGLELDPVMIRQATLVKVRRHRDRLQAWIREAIVSQGGEPGRWGGDWPQGLPNKLREPSIPAADVITEIKQQQQPPHRAASGAPGAHRKTGLSLLLHADPVVLYAQDSEVRESDSALWSVLDVLADRVAYLIVSPGWTVLDRGSREWLSTHIRQLLQRFRRLVCVTICPTAGEAGALRGEGVATLHCSEGALVREDLYRPSHDREPKFDAIYDAQWADYKRHELAGAIGSLALIASRPWNPAQSTIDHYRRAHAAVSHATWVSSPWGPTRRWLSPEEVNVAYNEARVGLCLSRVEGYMSASVQYLLAGLPVVTTANLGGRDEFFDPAYVRWVGDEPEAVAAAVDELAGLELDPVMIRQATLVKVRRHRDRLQAWIREAIVSQGGEPGRWGGDWPQGLPNKLREPSIPAAEIIAEIEQARSAA